MSGSRISPPLCGSSRRSEFRQVEHLAHGVTSPPCMLGESPTPRIQLSAFGCSTPSLSGPNPSFLQICSNVSKWWSNHSVSE